MYKIIKNSEAKIRQISDNKIAVNLIAGDISPDVSLSTIKAKNYNEKETTPYDRIYYVLEGEMHLNFGSSTSILKIGDTCFIQKGTTYEMGGTFKVITVNHPAFGS